MRTSGSPFWRMIFTQKFVRAASLLPYTFPTEIIDSWQPFLKPSKRNSQTHISGVETMHEKLWPWTIYLSFSFFFFFWGNYKQQSLSSGGSQPHSCSRGWLSTGKGAPHMVRSSFHLTCSDTDPLQGLGLHPWQEGESSRSCELPPEQMTSKDESWQRLLFRCLRKAGHSSLSAKVQVLTGFPFYRVRFRIPSGLWR